MAPARSEFLASISKHDLGFLGARVTLVGSSDIDPRDTSVEFSALLVVDEFILNWADKRDESESNERSE